MIDTNQLKLNIKEIYPKLVKLTNQKGVLDLQGVYFWSVKNDFKIFLTNWQGIRFVKDIVAYWDKSMIFTFSDNLPFITSTQISKYSLNQRTLKGSYPVNQNLIKELLDKKCIFLTSIKDNEINTIIFPVRTTKGIVIVSLADNVIEKIYIEKEWENLNRAPKNCPISIKILDCTDKIFFIKHEGRTKLVFCTVDKNNIVERIKLISLKKIIGNQITE